MRVEFGFKSRIQQGGEKVEKSCTTILPFDTHFHSCSTLLKTLVKYHIHIDHPAVSFACSQSPTGYQHSEKQLWANSF